MADGSITISAVGDISFGDHPLSFGYGVRSVIEKKGEEYLFKHIKPYLENSDIIFGNLECVLSDSGLQKNNMNSVTFRGAPAAINSLTHAGFNIINIANNHILQHGVEAYNETVDRLKEHNISIIGKASHDGIYFSKPAIKEINGIKVGFLGYSFIKENYFKDELLYASGSTERVFADISRLKKQADICIVSCHWGLEIIDRPSLNTIQLARAIVDHGADIIIGHHPHVFQAVERYRKGLILYSVGNFIFDCPWEKYYKTGNIVKIEIQKNKDIEYDLSPFRINKEYQPIPITGLSAEKFINHVQSISNKKYYDNYNEMENSLLNYYADAYKHERAAAFKKAAFLVSKIYRVNPKILTFLFRKLTQKLS